MTRKQKKLLLRILVSAVLMLALQLLPLKGLPLFGLYLIPYCVIGYDILLKAAKGIWNRQVFDENFLMAVATLGALVIGLSKTGDYVEAVAVMLFYQIGELFQSCAIGKSRRSIAALMDIRPDYANLEVNGVLHQVDPEEVAVGSHIVVQPGERIPLDGIIREGCSTLDTAALTGESLPREVAAGDEVISGCINLSGVLTVRTTKEFGESTVSKILDLVENASSRKSHSENFISKFARYYTPAVCFGAMALAVFPPLLHLLLGQPAAWLDWLYRALTFLVISCPCALVISIPLSFFAGLGGASRAGILIKGSNYLEALSKAKIMVFDKTGTLTEGVFRVSAVRPVGMSETSLLKYAALAESASSHPISKSLQAACNAPLDRNRVCDIQEESGLGITASVDGIPVAVGNERLMQRLGLSPACCESLGTVVHVAVNGCYAGQIEISDRIKENSPEAIRALKQSGIRQTVILSGDRQSAASQVAARLGVEQAMGELLPGDKVAAVEELLLQKGKKELLVFVGDGINDAPVLSRADVGIAMGAMGSDAAIEAADIVLMDDDPLKIAAAIRISRKCMGIVYENIALALGIKLLCLLLGALGIANLWLAIFADVGVMVLAVLNAIRALYGKERSKHVRT